MLPWGAGRAAAPLAAERALQARVERERRVAPTDVTTPRPDPAAVPTRFRRPVHVLAVRWLVGRRRSHGAMGGAR